VVGGGPAGMMLGYLLARGGIDVVVIEKHGDFLRDFRGDTIHPSTMEVLHEVGLLEDFLRLPHDKTTKVSAHVGATTVTVADFDWLRVRAPFIAFTPQWHFLNFLADAARALPTFTLLMETEAVDLLGESSRVTGVMARDRRGALAIRAELVVGADGRHSVVRNVSGLEVIDLGAPVDVLWFRISKRPSDPKQLSGLIDQGKLLVMVDRGDYWQCAFNVVKGGFEQVKQAGLEEFRASIAKLAPFVADRVDELVAWDDVKVLSVSVDRLRKWHAPGVLCIGDSAHAMSPMGGVGINLAVQDAVAASNVLLPAFRRGAPTEDDLARVQKRREFPTRVTQRFQIVMQDRLLLPYLRRGQPPGTPTAFRLFNWIPFLRLLPARFIGMGVRPEHVEAR
jgi:2-polyprenyl-6-methoxyphenol hydroxylase-like FAD-dependent oxidoreductase